MMITIPHFNFPSCPICDAPLVQYEVRDKEECVWYACGCKYRFSFDPASLDTFQNITPCPEAQKVAMEFRASRKSVEKVEEISPEKIEKVKQLEDSLKEAKPIGPISIGPDSSEEDIHRWQEGLKGKTEQPDESEQPETFQKSVECLWECTDLTFTKCHCNGACNVCHR